MRARVAVACIVKSMLCEREAARSSFAFSWRPAARALSSGRAPSTSSLAAAVDACPDPSSSFRQGADDHSAATWSTVSPAPSPMESIAATEQPRVRRSSTAPSMALSAAFCASALEDACFDAPTATCITVRPSPSRTSSIAAVVVLVSISFRASRAKVGSTLSRPAATCKAHSSSSWSTSSGSAPNSTSALTMAIEFCCTARLSSNVPSPWPEPWLAAPGPASSSNRRRALASPSSRACSTLSRHGCSSCVGGRGTPASSSAVGGSSSSSGGGGASGSASSSGTGGPSCGACGGVGSGGGESTGGGSGVGVDAGADAGEGAGAGGGGGRGGGDGGLSSPSSSSSSLFSSCGPGGSCSGSEDSAGGGSSSPIGSSSGFSSITSSGSWAASSAMERKGRSASRGVGGKPTSIWVNGEEYVKVIDPGGSDDGGVEGGLR
eukprot:scaffold90233_cov32-Tisochrysis_lutea.AAC.6